MKTGKAFWRTLDELADDPSFVERLHNEFPSEVEAITDPTTRRTFMKLMGASLALACGLGYCERRHTAWKWREGRPGLSALFDRIAARASFAATVPPPSGI